MTWIEDTEKVKQKEVSQILQTISFLALPFNVVIRFPNAFKTFD